VSRFSGARRLLQPGVHCRHVPACDGASSCRRSCRRSYWACFSLGRSVALGGGIAEFDLFVRQCLAQLPYAPVWACWCFPGVCRCAGVCVCESKTVFLILLVLGGACNQCTLSMSDMIESQISCRGAHPRLAHLFVFGYFVVISSCELRVTLAFLRVAHCDTWGRRSSSFYFLYGVGHSGKRYRTFGHFVGFPFPQ